MHYEEQNPKLKRSSDYRKQYFKQHKGLLGKIYFCPYCGKVLINKQKIQIDHIQAIKYVQTRKSLRKKFNKLENGVNDTSNLTASCNRCNSKKGRKGGLWVFLGRYGIYFMPVVRLILIIMIFISCIWVYFNESTIQALLLR